MIDKAAAKLKSDGWSMVETSGFLHLVGYDHEKSRAEARRMFARERELAAALVKMSQAPAHTPGGVED